MSTSPLPHVLYRADIVRKGEQLAAQTHDIAMYTLMERAGQAVFTHLCQSYPQATQVLVCCGGGNNGGDGYVVARLAKEAGMAVTLWHSGDATKLCGDAALARDAWLAAGGKIAAVGSSVPTDADIIVDAILGTGLTGTVRPAQQALIETINASTLPVIAIDVPSGLCADSGAQLGAAIVATSTVTFIGVKQGLVTGQAHNYVGELCFAGLEVDATFQQQQSTWVQLIPNDLVTRYLGTRQRTAHKGEHGRVTCFGGDLGMAGAIRLASEACARTGAGLTAVVTQPDNVLSIVAARPEIMAKGWFEKAHEIQQQRDWSDVVVLGPGLGTQDWGKALYFHLADYEKKLVVDADGLNLLALSPDYKNNRIITPHPGEAARLLGCTVAEIEADRYAAVRQLQQKYGGVVVLKGAGTLVDDGQYCYVCRAGNPGMATGGMGDVLSGVIGALLAQKLSLIEAAQLGVWLHSYAADLCAQEGERGMLASDLFPYIRQLVNAR
ncbi:bifunctional ADP-dependent (S)-NAD(P)H-hydrate dehydratase/NAD(P)H-hydrate epimerase [Photobacterium jeanii]|uniref:Bifunctional NAD(P)H-hydrate repair enzyme n=1 Tax=Photobacterium jeanii TaxID=858640 RepID=A0A178KRE1_9GAMM|nr:bifunctional ADP-dependent NAD(P)H-hydrate dehydratase/NAD(P)H-hydrate epimerase [Photobacterium jeanii]OAN19344.1 bifunctional ADP-dependent (S)-NAD(P)H-hydrate dehydratase/NAD(P)H-hydrate epimerase [Photobacterium jeanii]PST86442.1 bifunctional ADP-dependent NAD(P)H-hydrate dehydratase/NAD(P)H-hydrate epimerase [Photobacterium jeanii]